MNTSIAHTKLVHEILIECGSHPKYRLWKNAVGVGQSFDLKRVVSYGLEGSPDLMGIMAGGFFIGIECKTGRGVQSLPQKRFMEMCRSFGAFYGIAHSVSEAQNLLSDWVKIASES